MTVKLDELRIEELRNSISESVGTAGGSGAVGGSYAGYLPGYGPVPSIPPVYTGIGIQQPTYQPNVHISGTNPILTTDKGKIDLNELVEMMKIMRERLLILVPDFEKHEKYEALKKAYDHYKLIEAIVTGKEDGK